MAGLGKKTFAAGEVLRAADVNGYLMDQAVQVYAGTAARGSAVGTATNGMISYLADTAAIEVYNSGWLPGLSVSGWTAYTPTVDWVTLGTGGTKVFYFKQVGKTVHVRGTITLGTGGSLTGPVDFTLPVNLNTSHYNAVVPMIGQVGFTNNSNTWIGLINYINSATYVRASGVIASQTWAYSENINSTSPFTWANGHKIVVDFYYEAA